MVAGSEPRQGWGELLEKWDEVGYWKDGILTMG